jgi:hypothetical protein
MISHALIFLTLFRDSLQIPPLIPTLTLPFSKGGNTVAPSSTVFPSLSPTFILPHRGRGGWGEKGRVGINGGPIKRPPL